jgi:hypothetical protein
MNGRSRKKGGGTPLAATARRHLDRVCFSRDGTGWQRASDERARGWAPRFVGPVQPAAEKESQRGPELARPGTRHLLPVDVVHVDAMRCDAMLGWGDAWPPANSKRNQWRDDARARAAREGGGPTGG